MKTTLHTRAGCDSFLLFAALCAATLVAVWVPWFLGLIGLEMAFSPSSWHAHELLFGFMPVIVGSVLLTAVGNRTERRPLAAWPFAALIAVWIVGRLGVAGSAALEPLTVALLALLFPAALIPVAGWKFLLTKNGRSLTILTVLAALVGAQSLFHWELWRFGRSVHGTSLAVAALLTWTMLGGGIIPDGRGITPSLAGKRRKARGNPLRHVRSTLFNRVAMGLGLLALATWILREDGVLDERLTGALLLAAGFTQTARLARWRPHRAPSGLPVFVLHVARTFIPAGFLLAAWASLGGDTAFNAAALHAWTMGAVGGMTLAVMMTQSTLAHNRHALTTSRLSTGIHLAVAAAACACIAASLDPQHTMLLIPLAGVLWIAAFLMLALVYGRKSA
ncbi:NnrS family protein [Azospirillum brasilense]|uniref:NnrS family protein n=1 Tax=Azospirillum brasilense TaxID=192 RepID=A0A6L3AY88_AZOBR|nr:NnrS family protein [Azospirillum brasilense]KAA0684544.1 NnrS family protein [Azospirillum brasilense]